MSDRDELVKEMADIELQIADIEFELFAVLQGHDPERRDELNELLACGRTKRETSEEQGKKRDTAQPKPLTGNQIMSMQRSEIDNIIAGIEASFR